MPKVYTKHSFINKLHALCPPGKLRHLRMNVRSPKNSKEPRQTCSSICLGTVERSAENTRVPGCPGSRPAAVYQGGFQLEGWRDAAAPALLPHIQPGPASCLFTTLEHQDTVLRGLPPPKFHWLLKQLAGHEFPEPCH